MADGHFPTLVSKDRNSNAQTNAIWVAISDQTNAAGVDGSGNLQIVVNAALPAGTNNIGDVDVLSVIPGTGATNLGKSIGSVAGATDTAVAVAVIRDDALTTLADAEGDYVGLRVDSTGALWVNTGGAATNIKADDSAFTVGTDNVGVAGFLADETTPDSVDEGDVGAARMTLDRKQLMVLVDATTDANRLAIDGSGNAQVDLAAVSVTAVPVSKDGNANSETNPLYVYQVNTVVSGSEIHDYDEGVDIASDTADNHDYTVAGSTFLLKSVILASSGGSKLEIQTGPVAGLTTKAVGFIPKQGGVIQLFFEPAIEVPVASTGTVRAIRTNRQGSAQSLYSTIIGNDVA